MLAPAGKARGSESEKKRAAPKIGLERKQKAETGRVREAAEPGRRAPGIQKPCDQEKKDTGDKKRLDPFHSFRSSVRPWYFNESPVASGKIALRSHGIHTLAVY
jgi:hypothetical protein